MEERILQVVSAVLNVPVERVDATSSPETIESWDSLRQMNLILALEEEFDVTFSDEQIVEMLSVEAIIDALRAKRMAA